MKEKLLVIYLIFISAIPPLTTDLYLPSLPIIVAEFHATEADVNFTLISFSIFFGAATLIWGPLSDKYGRKPVLIIGFLFYFAGSLLCAFSVTLAMMSATRILQGVGCGSGMAVGSAVVRDVFTGRRQEGMLAVIQSMIMIAPLVAPLIGSFIIHISGWRGVFFSQAFIGVVLIAGSLIYRETLEEKNSSGVFHVLARLGPLMRHGRFAAIIILFSLPTACIMAYVSTSTYIYQDHFRLSAYEYSLFFGAASAGAIAGPVLYIAVINRINRLKSMSFCFAAVAAVGVITFIFGELSPWFFASAMLLLSLFCGMMRPAAAYLALNYHERDTGAASSLLGSCGTLCGCIGMAVATIYPRYVRVIGMISIIIGAASETIWLLLSRKYDVG